MGHIFGYIVVAVAVLLGIPTLAGFLLAGLMIRIPALRALFGAFWSLPEFLASWLIWIGIAYLWQLALGQSIPIALLIAASAWVVWSARDEHLSELGRILASAELWGILVAGVFVAIYSDAIRWY